MAAENLIDELLADAGERMVKSAEAAQHEFSTVRTGRASPALLDRVVVDYYGAMTPLNQLSTISAPEARLITVQPYDKSSIKAIEKQHRRPREPAQGKGRGDPRGLMGAAGERASPAGPVSTGQTATDRGAASQGARYVAIITDGNGRWARARGLSVNDGHSAGA